MVAQRDEPKRHRPAAFAFGVAVPGEIIVVQDRLIEQLQLARRYEDDRGGLDQRARRDRCAGEEAAALLRIVADFQAVVGDRAQAVAGALDH
jgi:hypothetical protein